MVGRKIIDHQQVAIHMTDLLLEEQPDVLAVSFLCDRVQEPTIVAQDSLDIDGGAPGTLDMGFDLPVEHVMGWKLPRLTPLVPNLEGGGIKEGVLAFVHDIVKETPDEVLLLSQVLIVTDFRLHSKCRS
jgi:hypothetical protein